MTQNRRGFFSALVAMVAAAFTAKPAVGGGGFAHGNTFKNVGYISTDSMGDFEITRNTVTFNGKTVKHAGLRFQFGRIVAYVPADFLSAPSHFR